MMWWLAIPAIGLIGKVIHDAVTVEKFSPSPQIKTILELNLDRLNDQLGTCSGRKIAIMGQPGAGKSSLLKKITNGKVRPLPIIGVQTDATDWSTDLACNLLSYYKDYAFADVPGYGTLSHSLEVFSSCFPFRRFDAYIFVIRGKLLSSDEDIFRLILKSGKKIFIARSFSENISDKDFMLIENDIRSRFLVKDFVPVIFFSNRTSKGIDEIIFSIENNIL